MSKLSPNLGDEGYDAGGGGAAVGELDWKEAHAKAVRGDAL